MLGIVIEAAIGNWQLAIGNWQRATAQWVDIL
jgi:hypothetical protein